MLPMSACCCLPHIPVSFTSSCSLHTRFQRIKMSGLLRGIARIRTAPVLRGSTITQRANITTRPAKDKFGPVETAIGLTVFSFTILGPSGWILANLESYKKKDAAESE